MGYSKRPRTKVKFYAYKNSVHEPASKPIPTVDTPKPTIIPEPEGRIRTATATV